MYYKTKGGYVMDLTGVQPLSWARKEALKGLTLKDFTDPQGFIGRREPDGIDCGDGMQRTAMKVIGDVLTSDDTLEAKINGSVRLLSHKIGPAQYVRRPDPQLWRPFETAWQGRLNTTTGDQIRPLIAAMGFTGQRQEVKEIFKALLKRGGFYWNTRDTGQTRENEPKKAGWSGPEHWNIFIRALFPRSNFLVKLLLLPGDFVGLLSTINATFFYPKNEPFKVDQLNRIITLLQGILVNPTPISKLSHYLFCKFRPTHDVYVDKNWTRIARPNDRLNPALFVLETYFWHPTDPPLEQGAWRQIALKYFGRP